MFNIRDISIRSGSCYYCSKPDTFFVVGDSEHCCGDDKELCTACALKTLREDAKGWEKYCKGKRDGLEQQLQERGHALRRMIAMLEARK